MIPVACVVKQPPGFEARRRGGPASSRLDMALLKRGVFSAQALGSFLQAAGNIVPLFYLPTYSTSVLAYSSSTGSLLLALNNAVNSVARIVMGIVADRVGRQNTMIISVASSFLPCSYVNADKPFTRSYYQRSQFSLYGLMPLDLASSHSLFSMASLQEDTMHYSPPP